MPDRSHEDGADHGEVEGTVSWRALRDEAVVRLASVDGTTPEAEARWLVEEASGWEGADHVVHLDDLATEKGVLRFDAMLARRAAGEPLQYVLGHWPFRTLDLLVDRRVLIPRPETEEVAGHALAELAALAAGRDEHAVAVDLGTGSGAIALTLAAEQPRVTVWGTDRSADALAVARANLAGIGTWPATRVRLVEGDWYAALPPELVGEVHLIVSNPPYIAAAEDLPAVVGEWEPSEALVPGPTGLEAVAHIVAEAPRWLDGQGVLVVEIGADQGEASADLARAAGFATVEVRPDLAGRPRALVARR